MSCKRNKIVLKLINSCLHRHVWSEANRRYEPNRNYTRYEQVYTSQTRRNTGPITADQFNVKAWNAWHYGDDAIITDAVKQVKKEEPFENKDTRYYRKVNEKAAAQDNMLKSEQREKLKNEEKLRQDEILSKMKFRADFRKRQMKDAGDGGDGACVTS